MTGLIVWMDAHQGVSGWVQAVGSLIGLGVAIWVPNKLHRSAERARKEAEAGQARSLAIVVRRDLRVLLTRINFILDQWPEGKGVPPALSDVDTPPVAPWDYFEIPDVLLSIARDLHLLGDAAKSAQKALHFSQVGEDALNGYGYEMEVGYGNTQLYEPNIRPSLVKAKACSEDAIERLAALFT